MSRKCAGCAKPSLLCSPAERHRGKDTGANNKGAGANRYGHRRGRKKEVGRGPLPPQEILGAASRVSRRSQIKLIFGAVPSFGGGA